MLALRMVRKASNIAVWLDTSRLLFLRLDIDKVFLICYDINIENYFHPFFQIIS